MSLHREWNDEPWKWNARPLAERLEMLRKDYCTGPCAQAHSVLQRRAYTSASLNEAIIAVNAHAELVAMLRWVRDTSRSLRHCAATSRERKEHEWIDVLNDLEFLLARLDASPPNTAPTGEGE